MIDYLHVEPSLETDKNRSDKTWRQI